MKKEFNIYFRLFDRMNLCLVILFIKEMCLLSLSFLYCIYMKMSDSTLMLLYMIMIGTKTITRILNSGKNMTCLPTKPFRWQKYGGGQCPLLPITALGKFRSFCNFPDKNFLAKGVLKIKLTFWSWALPDKLVQYM